MSESSPESKKPKEISFEYPSDLPSDPLASIRGVGPAKRGDHYVKDKLQSLLDSSIPGIGSEDDAKREWAQQTLLVRKKKLQKEQQEQGKRPRHDLRDAETVTLAPRRAPTDPAASLYETAPRQPDAPRDTEPGADQARPSSDTGFFSRGPAQNADAFYRPIRIIGEGGFGTVWEAEQVSLGRTIAIKRLHDRTSQGSVGDDFEMLLAFRQEAYAAAFLEHPNIIPIYDLAIDSQGKPVIAMKRAIGTGWDVLITEDFRKLSPEDFLAAHIPIMIQVAQAIRFAHSRGIVHRDIKPSQVMVGDFGEVLLMDWGLAVSVDPSVLPLAWRPADAPMAATIDWATNPAGTPAFMAPEQASRSNSGLGPWTDCYLLGSCLYMLLTGAPPHTGTNAREVFARVAAGHSTPIEQAIGDRPLPSDLRALIDGTIGVAEPSQRLTAAQFVDGLRAYLAGASSRAESTAITDQVAAAIEGRSADYEQFAGLLSRLAKAQALWMKNPAVGPLRARIRRSYAQAALRNGDLMLARVEAELLDAADGREVLLGQVQQAERHRSLRNRQRKAALAGVVALSILSAVFGLVAVHQRTESERRRVEAETSEAAARKSEKEARESRARAEIEQYYSGIGFAAAYLRDQRFEKVMEMLQRGIPLQLRGWEWGYLLAQTSREDAVLLRGTVAAGEAQFHSAWSPDGKALVTGGLGGRLRIWDTETLRLERVLETGLKAAWCIEFNPTGDLLLVTSFDGRAVLVDFRTGETVRAVEMAPSIGSLRTMRGGGFSPDGKRFVTTGTDNTVTCWNVDDGSRVWRTTPDKPTYDAVFSPDGSFVAAVTSRAGDGLLLDSATGSLIRRFEGHQGSLYSVRFSPDGRHLVTTASDQKARVFDVATGTMLFELPDAQEAVRHAVYSPDGINIATATASGVLHLWDSQTGRHIASQQGPKQMDKLAYSPDGSLLVSTSYNEVRLWGSRNLGPAEIITPPPDFDLNTVPDRLRTVSYPFDRSSIWLEHDLVWQADGGRHLLSHGQEHYLVDGYYSIYAPDGTWRLEFDPDRSAPHVTALKPAGQPTPLAEARVFNAAVSPDGSMVALGLVDGSLQLYTTDTWNLTASITPATPRGALWSLAFSPDGTRLVLGWQKGIIELVTASDLKSRWLLERAHDRQRPVVGVNWSPDGKRIVSASSDETARVWDSDSGRLVSTLTGHALNVMCASFSRDGSRILTVSMDQSAKLWLAESGREIMTVFRLEDPNDALVGGGFSADGQSALIATRRARLFVCESFSWKDAPFGEPTSPDFPDNLERWKRGLRIGPQAATAPVEW
ncbi:protein kinase [bacterium]|nr:protein kinase [bacterium]